MTTILLYGATGYMGKLTANELAQVQVQPILAARNPSVQTMAQTLGYQSAVFSLDDQATIERNLRDVDVVINLAGPFQQTQQPLIQACLATGCHYLDIAGEVAEMQSVYAFDEQARQKGIMLMPGAGFGVVPTDIAAKMAHELMPDATHLTILYATKGGVSRGTLKTILKDIHRAGVRRVNNSFVTAQPAESQSQFQVHGKDFKAVYNPWRADLFTAGISTTIPNIATYSEFPGVIVAMMKGRLLWLRNLLLNRVVNMLPEGPSSKQLASGSTYVMARVNNSISTKSVAFKGPEAYRFTALCLRAIVDEIKRGHFAAGFQTPAFYGKPLLDAMNVIEWD